MSAHGCSCCCTARYQGSNSLGECVDSMDTHTLCSASGEGEGEGDKYYAIDIRASSESKTNDEG